MPWKVLKLFESQPTSFSFGFYAIHQYKVVHNFEVNENIHDLRRFTIKM